MTAMDTDQNGHGKLLVGIDEAGYGPNLGPLVVAAATLEVRESVTSSNLWKLTRPTISRHPLKPRATLVIDDSKRVYSNGDGLDCLERAALAWLGLAGQTPESLRHLWRTCCLTPSDDIDEARCFVDRDLDLPFAIARESLATTTAELAESLGRAGIGRAGLWCQIIMPRRFNQLVNQFGSKSEALFQINVEILRRIWDQATTPRIQAVFDKHGGRNFYAPSLQQEFLETLVIRRRESAAVSEYLIAINGRSLEASFVPRGDSAHLLVALASMFAKYVRELWMVIFNAFWSAQVSELQPTAGYPTDSKRFWSAIEPAVERLGIERDMLWRHR